jgi:hypothetical protein
VVRPDQLERDVTIARRVLAGEYCRVVAQEYGLSGNRVQQIVRAVCAQMNPAYFASNWGPSLWQLRDDREQFRL